MLAMKRQLSFNLWSRIFGVYQPTCINTVRTTLKALAAPLERFLLWTWQQQVLNNMRICYREFGNTMIVLDCTEIGISQRKCLQCRIRSYSHYKKGNTLNFVIGVSPGSLIIYVSQGYDGRSPDRRIFEESDILERLLPGIGGFMVDKDLRND